MSAPVAPRWARIGPDYEDRGGFGAFVVPAPARDRAPLITDIRRAPDLAAALSRRPLRVVVTSTKALKWSPALRGLVGALATTVPGRAAEALEAQIAARGLDRARPLHASDHQLELFTLAVDSEVPDQPWGPEQGLAGARGRAGYHLGAPVDHPVQANLRNARASHRLAVVVSFENYISEEAVALDTMPLAWRERHLARDAGPAQAFSGPDGQIAVDRAAVFVAIAAENARIERSAHSLGVALPYAYAARARALGQARTAGQLMAEGDPQAGLPALGVPHDSWHGRFLPGLDRRDLLEAALRRALGV